ncbi:cell envelope integrity EipB family protein [Pannonibacter tanglangensis]|uniref:DUF1849 family protein n=1 Tax=Pannonibacter tanglangensis TaxID=2750084 RepID=A0ABW9ZL30_9HYPH|nr:cell envelope integrity EipB family protein [Pannonibacter sp. XCT-34]NBN63752.1 DUF1849 family protein [Pannonibacter sp. XCT-34]
MSAFAAAVRALSLAAAVCASSLGMGVAPAQSAGSLPLVPHRAVYDMKLGDAAEGTGIAALTGRMVYEFSGNSCDGYSVTFRFVSRFEDEGGLSQVTDLRTSSFEEPQSGRYQFLTQTYVDQALSEETRGTATATRDRLRIALAVPEEKKLDINGQVYFPISHLKAMIEAAKRGEPFFEAEVFDGAETGDKVYATGAVIGARQEGADAAGEDDAAAVGKIGAGARWPVTISYFDPTLDQGGEATPVYQISFLLYENGVTRRLVLDYGDFKIEGQLKDLVVYPLTDCQ